MSGCGPTAPLFFFRPPAFHLFVSVDSCVLIKWQNAVVIYVRMGSKTADDESHGGGRKSSSSPSHSNLGLTLDR